jgi:hypothetical protein
MCRTLRLPQKLRFSGPSGILVGRSSAFSYSASRYSYSYSCSKTPGSIQVDHLFREAVTPLFGPFVNEILILLFEYEYRFTEYEYEYEKNHWYELLATIMPDGPHLCWTFTVGKRQGRPQMAATSRRKALNYATILENHVDVRDSDDISQLEPKRCRIPTHPKSSA